MGAMTGIFCRCEENGWKEIAVVAHGAIIRTLMEACLETTEDTEATTKSESTTKSDTFSNSKKTGDDTPLLWYLVLMTICGGTVITLGKKKFD